MKKEKEKKIKRKNEKKNKDIFGKWKGLGFVNSESLNTISQSPLKVFWFPARLKNLGVKCSQKLLHFTSCSWSADSVKRYCGVRSLG